MTMYGEFERPDFTYEDAIREAGFTLVELLQVGDYQGSYFARVEGGWLFFFYGSCGGCDSIQAFNDEIGWRNKTKEDVAAEFRKEAPSMVGGLLTDEEILRQAGATDGIDFLSSDQKQALEFVYKFIPRGNA